MRRRRWLWRRRPRAGQVIAWGTVLGATALVSVGLVFAAFSISGVGGVLATLLVVVFLAVIWMDRPSAK